MSRRADALARLAATEWDLLVAGGGITGAGVAREAARRGWRVALVEQRDFAWGTSSRSSKLVHGGLRYLSRGHIGLALESVRERDRLQREAPELIETQRFVIAHGGARDPGRRRMALGLAAYDAMAGSRDRRFADRDELRWLAPGWAPPGSSGATGYRDAKVDDSRLVQRVLDEARRDGALALNYVAAEAPLVERQRVRGLALRDTETGVTIAVHAKSVLNATGAWADRLRAGLGREPMMRPLRGSHLVIAHWRLPVAPSITLLHPDDGRPVFFYPWEGATLVGTTDLEHAEDLMHEPRITPAEVRYLLDAVNSQFPRAALRENDVIASFAGVRPIVGTAGGRPSDADREHVVVDEAGLVTVSGGKLTTFRTMAQDALARAAAGIGKPFERDDAPVFAPAPALDPRLQAPLRHRLAARYGADAARRAAQARPGDFETIGGTPTLWLELRVAAADEDVVHLDDLLLRRTRLGMLTTDAGLAHEDRLRTLCRETLDWDAARWAAELARYRALIRDHYRLPPAGIGP